MTASLIEKLRKGRGEHTWLEDLKSGSTESFVDEIREGLRDPEWSFGPAELVSSYLTGEQPHILAEKSNGSVLRVFIEGGSTDWKFGKVEMRDVPESIPTLNEEVLESARGLVDHILQEDTPELDVVSTLETITAAVLKNPKLVRDLRIESAIQELDPKKIWYLGQIPESVEIVLSKDSSVSDSLSAIKGRLASVIECIKESTAIDFGLKVVIESVLEDSRRVIGLLNSCLELEEGSEHHRKVSGALSVVPEIHRALGFIQGELSEAATSIGG